MVIYHESENKRITVNQDELGLMEELTHENIFFYCGGRLKHSRLVYTSAMIQNELSVHMDDGLCARLMIVEDFWPDLKDTIQKWMTDEFETDDYYDGCIQEFPDIVVNLIKELDIIIADLGVREEFFIYSHGETSYSSAKVCDYDSSHVGCVFSAFGWNNPYDPDPNMYYLDPLEPSLRIKNELKMLTQHVQGLVFVVTLEVKKETCACCHSFEWEELDCCGFIYADGETEAIESAQNMWDVPVNLAEYKEKV